MNRMPQHELLERDVGTWRTRLAKFMGGANSPPVEDSGVEVNTLLTGGMWLKMDFRYVFPGGKFEGIGLYGYDPMRQKYVGIWADSTNPHLNVSEGLFDREAQRLTLTAEGVDPTNGQITRVKQVTDYDGDKKTFSVSRSWSDGRDVILLAVTATRADGDGPSLPDPSGSEAVGRAWAEGAVSPQHAAWTCSSPEHAILRQDVGSWDSAVVWYPPFAGSKPIKSTGIEECRLMEGGFWLIRETRTVARDRETEGVGIYGYDPAIGRYVGAWVDSTNPYRVLLHGDYDTAERKLTLEASGTDPHSGLPTTEKQVVWYDGNSRRRLSHYSAQESNGDQPLFEVVSNRRR